MHYNRFRYYDSDVGMFIQRDPIGLLGGWNVFAYADNPIYSVDPLGLTATCPSSPPIGDPNWVPYYGDPDFFHCGFDGYLENRYPTPNDPMQECFYDQGRLVTSNHPYAACGGTPNQYGSDNKWLHTFEDSGGVVKAGKPALKDSIRYKKDQAIQSIKDYKDEKIKGIND